MRIEKIKHSKIKSDGTFVGGNGAIEVNGSISMSAENGGCGVPSCHCSPGHYISIKFPRTKAGNVEEIKVQFDNKDELERFLKFRNISGNKK